MLDLEPFRSLVDRIVEGLLSGQKVVLRGLPKSGRTVLLEAVAAEAERLLEIPPVRFDGHTSITALEPRLERLIADSRRGFGLLLVDDLGTLLRSTHGATWQTRLNSQCVDGPHAKSIGVLMSCGTGENLSRIGLPGSPLVDSAHVLTITRKRGTCDRLAASRLPWGSG